MPSLLSPSSLLSVQHELAATLVSMGAVQSALEVFQRLQMWEKVIECYQVSGRHAQAERVVRERMEEEGESATLWCLLGDATQVCKGGVGKGGGGGGGSEPSSNSAYLF